MTDVTYFVALPFIAADDGIALGEAVECFNPNAAIIRRSSPSEPRSAAAATRDCHRRGSNRLEGRC